ncbi:MAG: exodeoxyribonuclease V subunit beta [Magnetococcales bacterium]|nr:exodeoxyribonuclease V subunit beta [Magnetococcales bacterium]NGZ05863.1 exodeoxyribonuclease V subunit beta [Magnetococcales bacterium]
MIRSQEMQRAGELPEVDPLTFPLQGSHLIEASAGTGKTYTIAFLYLRLVLGHGVAGMAPLDPPEILVVTFTRAATRELRERIRVRLSEAAACFRAGVGTEQAGYAPSGWDPLLLALRDTYAPEVWPGCAKRLQLAAEWMDEAAVETIHGWCHRMLRDHAFESHALLSQELAEDQSELLNGCVRDYWRLFLAPLPPDQAFEAALGWSSPQSVLGSIHRILRHAEHLIDGAEPSVVLGALAERRARLKAQWRAWVPSLSEYFQAASEAKKLNGTYIKRTHWEGWLRTILAWAENPRQASLTFSTETPWKRLTRDGLQEVWKQGTPPHHPALDALEEVRQFSQDATLAWNRLLVHAALWVLRRFAAAKEQRGVLGHDDVLDRLDQVLQGPNASRLAARIRAQFPAALIDEFQDTDPVQYRIFASIYPVGAPETLQGCALMLIGDPKQAIYAFRGGDVQTYLLARRALAGCIHTLRRNYRSTGSMVAAVNTVFEHGETVSPHGVFRYRSDLEDPMPFVAALAAGRQERFVVEGRVGSALTLFRMPAGERNGQPVPVSREAYRVGMAQHCAAGIVRLLRLGQTGRAGFAAPEGEMRPVLPRDVAVLVNNRTEYLAMRQALNAHGVRCVYLSDRESVFASPVARDLRHWLAACAAPENITRLTTALGTALFGLTWHQIDAVVQDERTLQERIDQFRSYRERWRQQGVLAMVRRLLDDFQVPGRLLRSNQAVNHGERLLTDLLHLGELLQKQSVISTDPEALIRYLDGQCAEAGDLESGSEDERQIRLESDEGLVRVVTVHKSKGLEYPLVFFPGAALYREVKEQDLPTVWRDATGGVRIAFPGATALLEQMEEERRREEIRKLYVVLTRARHATWIGLAPLNGFEKSGIGTLLCATPGPQKLVDLSAHLAAFDNVPEELIRVELVTPPESTAANRVDCPTERGGAEGAARFLHRTVPPRWWIGSFSALTRHSGSYAMVRDPESRTEERFMELERLETPGGATPEPERPAGQGRGGLLHAFPQGAKAGTFLHELLDWAANQGFARLAAAVDAVPEAVRQRCVGRDLEAWSKPLANWLLDLLQLSLEIVLPHEGIPRRMRLQDLVNYRSEMEFMMATQPLPVALLDHLVCRDTLDGMARPALRATTLHGMLKGFIDLVFEVEGCYFVVDFKSNHLGPDDASYTREAMRKAICHARYDLQYVLYLFALHRHLRARLPGYDYDRHVGGAIYLFLRGTGASGHGVFFERPPRTLFEELDRLFREGA